MKVFLSSVKRGLERERGETIDLLQKSAHVPDAMEVWASDPQHALEVCLEHVRSAHLMVCIVGPHYGAIEPASRLSYTRREYREAVQLDIPVLGFILRQQTDDPLLRDFAQELQRGPFVTSDVDCHSLAGQIVAAVANYRDKYGFGPRASFFQTTEKYFEPFLKQGAPFHHDHVLIGRSSELHALTSFVTTGEPRALVLEAAGGEGKSRLLLELGRTMAATNPDMQIRFVADERSLDTRALAELPRGPLCVVVDDAHRRTDLHQLIEACSRVSDAAKFILSSRPSGVSVAIAAVASLDLRSQGPTQITLESLPPFTTALELAQSELGVEHAPHATALVRVSDGNALIITLGAWCIRNQHVDARLLSLEPETFRARALDHLLDRVPAILDGQVPRDALLELAATIGPVDPAQHIALIAGYLRITPSSATRALDHLERLGLFLRRGHVIRVRPDVLADHLLFRAAVDARGNPTGYVREVYGGFASVAFANILRNAAELEWRCRVKGKAIDVLGTTWDGILQALSSQPHEVRAGLVRMVVPIAGAMPARAIELAQWLLDHPDAPPPPRDYGDSLDAQRQYVLSELPVLLRDAASDPNYANKVVSMLLTEAVERDTMNMQASVPRSWRACLVDLASYHRHRPFAVQKSVVDQVGEAVGEAPGRLDATWACDVCGAVLQRTFTLMESRGLAVTIADVPLHECLADIGPMRAAALRLLVALGKSEHPRHAGAAIERVCQLLSRPRGGLGWAPSEEDQAHWIPECEDAILGLAGIARDAKLRGARHAARQVLRCWRTRQWPVIKPSIDAARDGLPQEAGNELLDALDGPADTTSRRAELLVTAEWMECVGSLAATLWESHREPSVLFHHVNEAALERHVVRPIKCDAVQRLFEALVRHNAEGTTNVAKRVVVADGSPLCAGVPIVARELRERGFQAHFEELLQHVAAVGTIEARRVVADSFRWMFSEDKTGVVAERAIRLFLKDASSGVRCLAAQGLWNLAKVDHAAAVRCLVEADLGSTASEVDHVFMFVGKSQDIDIDRMTDSDIDCLVAKVCEVDDYQNTHCMLEFFDAASTRRPTSVVRGLLNRVCRFSVAAHRTRSGEVLPHSIDRQQLRAIAATEEFRPLCREVREHLLMDVPGLRAYVPRLVRLMMDEGTAIEIMQEWGLGGDSARVAAAPTMLLEFGHEVITRWPYEVGTLLENAHRHGLLCSESVRRTLWRVAQPHSWGGAVGEAPKVFVELKQAAEEARGKVEAYSHAVSFYKDLITTADEQIARSIARGEGAVMPDSGYTIELPEEEF